MIGVAIVATACARAVHTRYACRTLSEQYGIIMTHRHVVCVVPSQDWLVKLVDLSWEMCVLSKISCLKLGQIAMHHTL